MTNYYSQSLYGEKLKRVYDIAPPRVKKYLESEVQYIQKEIKGMDSVIELGCGYGRVMHFLSYYVKTITGIDTSIETLKCAQEYLSGQPCSLLQMDASHMGFKSKVFDAVICVQNGISAFHVDMHQLIREAIRITRPGGLLLFSSYSPKFWEERLKWFRLQAQEGLIGEIDESRTGNGIIVCKDGLELTFVGEDLFRELFASEKTKVLIEEVDESSVFARVEVIF